MAALCIIGGVTYTMVEDQHDLTNAVDERQRFQCDIIDYSGMAHFQKGEQVTITDPVLGVIYSGYLVSDKEVPQYPSGAILHTIDCSDQSWLAAKRTYTRTYSTPQLSSKIAVDQLHDVLLAEGITQNFALKFDSTQTDFSAGILSSAISTLNVGDGDLELAKAGSDVTILENTTAIFSTGTLTNVQAINNTLVPTTQNALRAQVTLPGGGSGSFLTASIWSGSQSIGTSDTFVYDIWITGTSPAFQVALDFVCSDGTLLSTSGVFDQNTQPAASSTDLSNYAKNVWYTRTITLTGLNGKTVNTVYLSFAGASPGVYTAYFRNIYLGSHLGSKILSPTATATNVNPPQVYQFANYLVTSLQTAIVSAFTAGNAQRVSTAYTISSVGLLKGSLVTVNGSNPSGAEISVSVSYDGVAFIPCTNNAPLPALPVGSNLTGLTLTLLEAFGAGTDPTALPILSSVSIALYSAPAATKSDIVTTYESQSQWNTGTFSNTTALSGNGGIVLSSLTRDWNNNLITNQTFFSPSGVTQSASGGNYAITTPNGGPYFGTSRLDFAGTVMDFTLDIDLKASTNANATVTYRQIIWLATVNNTAGYVAFLNQQTQVVEFGHGSNGPVGSYTQLATASRTITASTFYHMKIVVSGSHHQIYFNHESTPCIDMIDTSIGQAGGIGLNAFDHFGTGVTSTFDNFTLAQASLGTWTSPSVSLSSLGTCGASAISWTDTNVSAPVIAYDVIQTSIDGGSTYQTCTNLGAIPNLTSGSNVSSTSVIVKVTLGSQTNLVPTISNLVWRVLGAYPGSSGTRSTVPLGNDMSITRTVGSGFGTAFDGQTWTQVGTGTTAVTSGEETIANTTGDVHMVLGSRTWTDEDGTCRFSLSAATISAGIELRYTDANNFYRLQATTTTVSIIKMSGGGAITLASVSMALTVGSWYRMRFRVTGATQPLLQGNVWVDGTLEPTISATTGQWNTSNWTITAVD